MNLENFNAFQLRITGDFNLESNEIELLESAIADSLQKLHELSHSNDFHLKLTSVFGENIEAESLKLAWQEQDFSFLPPIEIRSAADLNGANGAYSNTTNKIYLAGEFINSDRDNFNAIVDLLLEEIGHSIDSILNATETPGDEGELFAALVQNKVLSSEEIARIKAENDIVTVNLDGQRVEIEQQLITGDGGNNSLIGTDGDDTIQGLGGNDNLQGRDGNDLLEGGNNNDQIYGEAGNDTLEGGAGNDRFSETAEADVIIGGEGNDELYLYSEEAGVTVDYSDADNGTTSTGGTIKEIENFYFRGNTGQDNVDASAANYADLRGGAGNDTLVGGAGNDYFEGNDGNDSIQGNVGNDRLYGQAGDDTLEGGEGNDRFSETAEADVIIGGEGNDELYLYSEEAGVTVDYSDADNGTTSTGGTIKEIENFYFRGGEGDDSVNATATSYFDVRGGAGNDTFVGGVGNDYIEGDEGNDSIQGNAGGDQIYGEAGDDTLEGGEGNDRVDGGAGNDFIDGGEGNDHFVEGAAADTIIGGAGYDRLDLYGGSEGLTINYSDTTVETSNGAGGTFQEIESFRFRGGEGDDSVNATATSYFDVRGGAGNDTFVGGVGNDYIEGDDGNDSIQGNSGNDRLYGEAGNDTLNPGLGSNDYANGGAGTDVLQVDYSFVTDGGITSTTPNNGSGTISAPGNSVNYSNIEQFDVTGTSQADNLIGGNLGDTLQGGAGSDVIDGGAGVDSLAGGTGSDVYVVNELGDTITENATEGLDTVRASVDYSLETVANVENLQLTGDGDLDGTGNSLNNQLAGNSGNNELSGNAGNDSLVGVDESIATPGVAEIDTLEGGTGGDTYILGDITRTFYDDGDDSSAGTTDYALITDFDASQDTIQLAGAKTDYRLDVSPIAGISGTAVYKIGSDGATDELIAIIQDVTGLDINSDAFVVPNLASGGLVGEYYDGYFNDDFSFFSQNQGVLKRTDNTINFNNSADSWQLANTPISDLETFTVRWQGHINIPVTGEYTFYLSSDDASYLFLDDAAFSPTANNATVNNGGTHGTQEISNTVSLEAGIHPISVIFGENSVFQDVFFSWSSSDAGIDKQIVPESVLLSTAFETSAAGTLNFSDTTYSINEDGTVIAAVTVTRTGGSEGEVGATINLNDGTATAPEDYQNFGIDVSFADGDTADKVIEIPVVDDSEFEPDETVNLTLSNATGGATLGAQSAAILTIVSDDAPQPGTLSFREVEYSVNEDGTPVANITIDRTEGSDLEVSTTVSLIGNTATGGEDYNSQDITVTFADGETSKTFTVPIIDDINFEDTETLTLTLTNPTNGAVIDTSSQTTLSIIDNEINNPVTLNDAQPVAIDDESLKVINKDKNPSEIIYTVTELPNNGNLALGKTALSLDGVDDYVEIPHDESLSLTTFTLETWINLERIKGDWQPILTKENNSGGERNYGLFIYPNRTSIHFSFMDENGSYRSYDSQNSLGLNRWNHIATTYDGSTFNLYINGELDRSIDLSSTVWQNSYPVRLGSEISVFTPLAGNLDDVRIWNVARTSAEIQANLNRELTGNKAGLVGYWQFNDVSDNIALDATENGNDGTINGAIPTYGVLGTNATPLSVGDTFTQEDIDRGRIVYQPTNNADFSDSFTFSVTDGDTTVEDRTFNISRANSPGIVSFSQANYTIDEDENAIAGITLTRTGGSNGEVAVTINLADGTAIAPNDYNSEPITVTFADGESSKFVTIPIVDDSIFEATENLSLTLSNPTNGVTLGDRQEAILNIVDNDAVAGVLEFSQAEYSVNEDGTPIVAVTVTRTGGSDGNVGVRVNLSDGSANQPADYNGNGMTVNFANGETSKTVNIPIVDDVVFEPDETINLTLSNVTGGATIGTQNSATLTIIDNDGAAGELAFSGSAYTVNEDGTPEIEVTVTRIGGSNGEVSAVVNLTDNTATAPDDYDNTPIVVTFANNETSKTISIPLVDDSIFEATENLNLTLTNPTNGATLGDQNTATLNIIDNDAVPGVLNFAEASYQVNEAESYITVTVNRTNGSDGNVSAVVLLSNGTATAGDDYVSNPITVEFANGETSKTITIPLIDDSVLESDETINLTLVNPTGGVTIGELNSSVVTIKDNDLKPTLTLNITEVSVNEVDGTVTATLTRNTATDEALTVSLASSDTSEIVAPNTVTIPAGASSVTVDLTVVDDSQLDSNPNVTLLATAPGFISASDRVRVINDDTVNLSLNLDSNDITEGTTKTITVTQNNTRSEPLVIELGIEGINLGEEGVSEEGASLAPLRIPDTVTIPAGDTSATFDITATDNSDLEGDTSFTITAKPTTSDTGTVIETGSTSTTVNIIDDESPSLIVESDRGIISETGTATLTITRNSDTTNPVTVNLSSSDTTEAVVPNSVTIPAGESSVTAIVTGINDNVSDGNQPVTITASASGLNSGETIIDVTDIDVPDLTITTLGADTPAFSDKLAQFNYKVDNLGLRTVKDTWVDRIYLSTDNQLDEGDELLTEFEISANIQVNQFYDRNVSYFNPRTPGTYYLIATTDADNQVDEGTGSGETNNTIITPFEVVPAYYAEVSTDTDIAFTGQFINLEGIVRSNEDNSPIPYEFVTIEIENNGFTRELSGFSDADGNFVRQFTPLPGEGGNYNIKAFFPDNEGEDTGYEDSFKVLGARFATESANYKVIADTPFTALVNLENLTDTPLTEFTAEVEGAPENWDIQVNLPNTLAGDGTNEIEYTITAPNESLITQDTFDIKLTSAEGVTAELPVTVDLERITPRLVATIGDNDIETLQSGMLRGEQTAVEITLTNEGGAIAENIDVVLPDAPWLSLATENTIESLAPGESTNVTLLLTPEANQDLTIYRGDIYFDAAGNDGDMSLPFEFRAVSEATGDLQVNVVDELFYFTEEAPKLEDAEVLLRDYFTGEELFEVTTDETGIINFEDLPEGYYDIEVRADDHETFRKTIEIDAGENEVVESFLSRQTVSYVWTVTPTEIDDEYHIQVESVFETNVPIPTIVVEPGSIDFGDLQAKGQVKQVDMTLTNHGLIGADDVQLLFNEEPNLGYPPEYKIEPLIESIDRLEAKSSITVPVRITRIADDSPESPCNLTGSVEWSYLAGDYRVGKSTPIAINNVEFGDCGHPPGPTTPGGGGGGGGGGVPIIIKPGFPGFNPPDPDFSVQVTIQIEQTAIMTRSAFLGELSIENSSDTIPLEDITVNLEVLDENGDVVNELFGITDPVLENITSVDGSGTLSTDSIGSAEWTFIPTNLAAQQTPEDYSIGGTLSYDQDGELINVPLVSTPITVHPQAELYVDYFHQRNVYGDDPFTDVTEVAEPFSLGVLVENRGFGAANNLSITSAQPKIIENEHGLLIDFDILGSQVNGKQASPSLTANFDNLEAGETAVADWILKSTLQGKFIEYEATFEHVNGLGNPELSLIKEVDIHELVRKVQADGDTLPDFLVNDEFDANFYPDIIYFSDGTTAPVTPIDEVTVDAPVTIFDLEAEITLPPSQGGSGGIESSSQGGSRGIESSSQGLEEISYITLDDPADGQFDIEKIVRSDGTEITADNIWRTDRTFPATGRPIYENKLHFIDRDSTGSYTVIYDSNDDAPPQVREIVDVEPNPRNTPVDNLQVVFTEPIRPNTFDAQDISLTLDDGTNLITDGVSVTQIDPITFQVNNLTGITSNIGQYTLSVDATGIEDLSGNTGAGTVTENWVFTGDRPAVATITGFDSNLLTNAVDTFDVTFTEEIVADSFDYQDISLTRNEGGNLVNDTVTVTQLDSVTYRVANLANFTDVEGDYELLVTANNIQDSDGNNGVGGKGFTWVLDNSAPTLTDIDDVNSPRNTPINSIEVTFDQAIASETFSKEDIALTLNGGDNLITEDVIVEKRNETTYIIKGLNSLQTVDGEYTLTVNGAAIEDNAGNGTTNSLSSSWELDTESPLLPINLEVAATNNNSTSANTNNSIPLNTTESGKYKVNSDQITITGDLVEENLRVYLQDSTTEESLGQAIVMGTSFQADIELSGVGSRTVELRVIDTAGNVTTDSIDIFSDVTQPAILEILNLPETIAANSVDYIDVVFSEAIDLDTFDYQDISLTRDGGENLITEDVTIENLSKNIYRINGLTDLTETSGTYQLRINSTAVEDLAGNAGLSNEVVSFLIDSEINLPTLDIDGNSVLESSDYSLIDLYASFGDNAALFDVFLQDNSDVLLGTDATRTTGEAISDYLSSNQETLFDLDGNGAVETADYSLLDLYGSFGANSAVLDVFLEENGDVLLGDDATRTTGSAIVDHLDQFLPNK